MILDKSQKRLFFVPFLIFMLLHIACEKKENPTIRIATAANMQFAMHELAATFKRKTGIKPEIIVSSSGKLTAQIIEGAPYDLFVSADLKYPNELFQRGLTIEKPKIYAKGKLILWSYFDSSIPSLEILTSPKTKHIAIANPKTAPYGKAAKEVLLKNNLFSDVESKLVYGESVAQTNQFITTKAAEFGFTSKSVVFSEKMKEKGNWIEIDSTSYSPIFQGVIVLKKHSGNKQHIDEFINFLISLEGKNILNKFGYSTSF